MEKIYLDDISGYRFKVFNLTDTRNHDGSPALGISATRYNKRAPLLTLAELKRLCKIITGKSFGECDYLKYESKEHEEWAKTLKGRLMISFWSE